jgi:curved DNA-binding protein
MKKNPYKILGVSETATPEEIKNAFRSKAKEFHPDINKSSDAEEKFKEIQNAYQEIKDGPKSDPNPMFNDFAYTNIWEFFNQAGQQRQQRNSDFHVQFSITLEQAYFGTELSLEIDGKSIKVAVPPGIDTGDKLRIAGAAKSNPNLAAGDVFLIMMVQEHPIYKRNKKNLMIAKEVNIMELLLNKPIFVKTIDGNDVELTIPKSFNTDEMIRVPFKGMKSGNDIGDMLVDLIIKIDALTEKQKSALFSID